MDDKITYGVFYRCRFRPDEWRSYSSWFASYEAAKKEAQAASKNTRFLEVRIVERTEIESLESTVDVIEWIIGVVLEGKDA